MAISIPAQIEQDFQSGKADYKSFQCGFGGQSVLEVPPGSSIIIYGYVLNPAGGGFTHIAAVGSTTQIMPSDIRQFGLQQVLFYSQDDFWPFIHNVEITSSPFIQSFDPVTGITTNTNLSYEVHTTPQERSVYIKANKSVSIAHGLVNEVGGYNSGVIPVTPETPLGLSYGGAVLAVGTQYVSAILAGALAQPNQYLAPTFSQWDKAPYAYGLYPAGATNQIWWPPHEPTGMYYASKGIFNVLGVPGTLVPNSQFYITLHYALYRNVK